MMHAALIDALCALLPAELEVVITKLGIEAAILSGAQAPQATRASEVIRYLDRQGRIAELEALVVRTAAPARPAAPEVSIGRLPRTGSDLFGREEELRWLDRCWEGGARVASIVAWGGVGKSALVNRWLQTMDEAGWRGAERVYAWSFYSQGTTDRVASADEFVSAALVEFGDKDPRAGSPWDKGERLAKLVKKRRTLLVLDGLEPMQWGPGAEEGKIKDPSLEALVRALGAQNEGMCLITSRIHVRDLDDFVKDKNPKLDLDHLAAEAGAQVLRARGVKGEEDELHEAVREYDGHSLALTLLGSYLRKAYKGDIRKWREVGPLAEKHTRRIMIAYERWFQGKPELAILRMLGLFDRPADEGEIDALKANPSIMGLTDDLGEIETPWWNEALTALRDVGLLAGAGEEEHERLDTHPLVREHFGEQLRRDKPEAWQRGHRRLHEHFKRTANALPETEGEMAPLYRAVYHGCLAQQWDDAYYVLKRRIRRDEEHWSLHRLGAVSSDLSAFWSFLDARSPPYGLAPEKKYWVENSGGVLLRIMGRVEESSKHLAEALKIAEELGQWAEAAETARNLASTRCASGDLKGALETADEAVRLAERSGTRRWILGNLDYRAHLLCLLGKTSESLAAFREIEDMHTPDDRSGELPRYPGSSFIPLLIDWGRLTEAHERARRALDQALALPEGTERRSSLSFGLTKRSLARALAALDRRSEAESLFDEAIEHVRAAGRRDHLAPTLIDSARVRLPQAPERARRDLDDALLIARDGFRLHEADAHLVYARLHLQSPTPAAAHPHLARARALIEATGYHRRTPELIRLEAACPRD